jgi:hypothetical protein
MKISDTAPGMMPQEIDPDVASIDGVVRTLYEVISGPAGAPRDWKRERKLFVNDARLIPTRLGPKGVPVADVFDVDGYIASRSPMFAKDSFFEKELERRTFVFGNIAHVLSSYELSRAPGEKPFMRGINSIQLFHDGQRWWVLSIAWDSERPDNPLPNLSA